MVFVQVRLFPGFPLGGGFPEAAVFAPAVFDFALYGIKCAKQQMINTPVVLCVSLEYCQSKKPVSGDALCSFWISPKQKPDRLLSGIFPSLRKSEHRQSNSLGTPILQRAVEFCRRSLILLCCQLKPPLAEMNLLGGAPVVFFNHTGANCSAGNPPPRGNPGLKRSWMDAILKNFDLKMNFKLKINVQRDRTNFRSINTICSLPQSHETVPFRKAGIF
jgi:hypothetical protein